MNTENTRRTATALATAVAAASALTVMSAVAPAEAGARPVDPAADPVTLCLDDPTESSTGSMEIDEIVTMLKVRRARYLADRPDLLR
ncbi:hypothetical protein [Nocardioides sp. YR527]|uniref:hypothetical protein n=1 Tax=Nocardioides sp. YR527 TaxID=1881028 RepID=UPI00115FF069|nr:hypothetical protein [Nocardioides sp. YR527]